VVTALRAVTPVPHNALAEALAARGRIFWRQDRFAEYEQTSREVLALAEAAHGPSGWGAMISRHNLSMSLFYVGRHAEAAAESRRAVARAHELLSPTHPFLLAALQRLGDNEAAQHRWGEAAAAYSEALAGHRAVERAANNGAQSRQIGRLEERLAAVRAGSVPAEVATNIATASAKARG
jgi:hypothetical protein